MASTINCQNCFQQKLEQRRWMAKQAAKRVQWALAASEDAPIEEEEGEEIACDACEQAFDRMSAAERKRKAVENSKASSLATASAAIPADIFWQWLATQPKAAGPATPLEQRDAPEE